MTAAEIALVLGDIRREGRDWRCRRPLPGGWSLALRDGDAGVCSFGASAAATLATYSPSWTGSDCARPRTAVSRKTTASCRGIDASGGILILGAGECRQAGVEQSKQLEAKAPARRTRRRAGNFPRQGIASARRRRRKC